MFQVIGGVAHVGRKRYPVTIVPAAAYPIPVWHVFLSETKLVAITFDRDDAVLIAEAYTRRMVEASARA